MGESFLVERLSNMEIALRERLVRMKGLRYNLLDRFKEIRVIVGLIVWAILWDVVWDMGNG